MTEQGSTGNVLAAICSFFIPGLGQLVQGRILPAILFFIFTAAGYALWLVVFPVIIAVIVHIWAIIDAARFSPGGSR
ncbi:MULTISPECIES: hypothetical protein [unclassified Agarivorans]|uniref:hypothetical protein n=1 Tax=unclassified Agarivorans TaxID=2636026 RepID=UPI0010F2581F|nr:MULTISPECIES: hypothetical protein [unclassified Agarivorans]MDO6684857.1 hypothetical protein [Agarivorans sp. 3_MG-2023]MDO6714982.1 hypothetical protein [Agarivorans sp. 2_MG-2023]GDY27524.1 hypothetical protein AHAT_34140 [Agarivorans sp. Toyoura001]